jgi:hypothetical protein
MRELIMTAAIKVLSAAKSYPTALTSPADLRALINKLHPRVPSAGLIRLGPQGDGGYLVPDDLAGIEACFSPGVSDNSGFEKSCADRGMHVYLADYSVDGPAVTSDRFTFTKKYLGAAASDQFMTMDGWVESAMPGSKSDLLLQIDIEGYEYEVLLSTSHQLMQRFRIIVGEFHLMDHFWSHPFFRVTSAAFNKILQTHTCVHVHPNNCCGSIVKGGLDIPRGMEFTFLRNDRSISPAFATTFPHPLDSENTPKPPLVLPKCWYRGS